MAFFRESLLPLCVAIALLTPGLALAGPTPLPPTSVDPTAPPITVTVTPVPDAFHVSSFFDVFVEISPSTIDSFQFTIPSGETPGDVTITDTSPDPLTIVGIMDIDAGGDPLFLDFILPFGNSGYSPLDVTLNTGDSLDRKSVV